MFVYGICIGNEVRYSKFAKVSLEKYAPGRRLIEKRHQSSIFAAYNEILDEARRLSELEGVVLLHEDVELLASIEEPIRAQLALDRVAIVGVIGGTGVRSVRWSRSRHTVGKIEDAYYGMNDHGSGAHDVDTVDGLVMALSPWAVKNLRFDEDSFTGFHAYDADICMQAKAAKRRVRVTELGIFHHTKGGFGDVERHRRSDDAFRHKWGIALDPWIYRTACRLLGRPY